MSVLVGKAAPDFTAAAVMGNSTIEEAFNLYSNIRGKHAVIFFYPLDFTFVCPTEIVAFDNRLSEFRNRNCEVIAVSVDSHFSHLAWKNTPLNRGGLGPVKFPMVADLDKSISRAYDVLHNQAVALRGTFLIDRDQIVRHQVVNDLPLGRNIDEAIRMVDALQFFEQHGEVCPAGWDKGKPAMAASSEGVASFLGEHAESL